MIIQCVSLVCHILCYDDSEWLRDISKMDFSLVSSQIDISGVPSQRGEVRWFKLFSWDGDYNAIVYKLGF